MNYRQTPRGTEVLFRFEEIIETRKDSESHEGRNLRLKVYTTS